MVMFGLHNGVAPLGVMQMADLGFDSIFGPGCVCSNIAQATASAVVAIRTKDKKLRQVAMSGSITAYMGITEPTLYGVNLPKKYPLIAAMIGGACGGLYAGLTQTHRFATGSSGLPAVLLYIGDNTMTCFYNILIALVITFIVTAVVTYVLSLKFEKEDLKETSTTPILDIKKEVITSPCCGQVYDIKEAKDQVFASEALGKGVMIKPHEGKVVAPISGIISTLFPSKHAIGIVSESGVEVLVHIGIDTVNLNGEYFETYVKQGDSVNQGDLLVSFDIENIEKAGYSTQTMVVITNSNNYQSIEKTTSDTITYNKALLTIEKG